MGPQIVYEEVSIVCRGNFTPAIFQPFWLASHQLIKTEEAENAQIEVLKPNQTLFTAEWLVVHITTDRLLIKTHQEPYYEPVRDLAIGLLRLLDQTPLRAMGLNRDFIYDLHSEEAWHGLGNKLTPKKQWQQILESPGMLALIVEGKRPDNHEGYIQVNVQPTKEKVDFGAFIEVNSHYTLATEAVPGKAQEVIEILENDWDNMMKQGYDIANRVVHFNEE
jgi:hypothetical protein